MTPRDNQEHFFVNGDAVCQVYKNVRDMDKLRDERNEIEELWQGFRRLAEPNFLDNAKHFLYAPLWEMELWEVLESLGFSAERFGTAGPDFQVTKNGESVLIEATVPQQGTGADKVPEHRNVSETCIATEIPEEKIILRFLNAIAEKYCQVERATKKRAEVRNVPYIIAINSCAIPNAHTPVSEEMPYIVKGVFPIGQLRVAIDRDSGNFAEARYATRENIRKSSGSNVGADIFVNPEYSKISAILYTHQTLLTRSAELSQELLLVHNPCAQNPIPRGYLNVGREFWVEDDTLHQIDYNRST